MGSGKDLLVLARVQTAAITSLTPVFGALAVHFSSGDPFSDPLDEWPFWSSLLMIGLLMHVFGFVQNEICDLEVDRRANSLSHKPLVKGSIGVGTARGTVIASIVGLILLGLQLTPRLWPLIVLVLSIAMASIYNIKGKSFPGSDVFLATWAFLFVIYGGMAAGSELTHLPDLLLMFATMAFLQIVFNNMIEGGMKDVDNDAKAGARTFAVVTGVRTTSCAGGNETLRVPPAFKVTAAVVKALHTSIALIALWIVMRPGSMESFTSHISQILMALVLAGVWVSWRRLFSQETFQRDRMLNLFGIHEACTYFIFPVVIFAWIDTVWFFFLMMVPFLWYVAFNRFLYGTAARPGV